MGGVMRRRSILQGLMPVAIFVFSMMITPVIHAAQSADDLYAKGEYKEATQAYQRLDMDRPGDLRYRYDRGCAAYMAGSLDEAKAAFSSVVRRSTSDDMRFRALHNLGNTAYKLNDFAAARDSYREALKVRPGDAAARHNLELSLKALKQQQKKDQQNKGDDRNQDRRQGQDEGGRGSDQKGQDQQGNGKKDIGQEGSQDQQQGSPQDQGKDGREGQQGKKPGQKAGKVQGPQDRQGQGKQDLKGELKGKGMQSGLDRQAVGRPADSAAAMERKKAEALLDNIGEDRPGMRDFQGSRGGRSIVGSGKEW